MNEEIKEITEEINKSNKKYFNYLINLNNKDLRKEIENCNWNAILQIIRYCQDYITNLQQENERLRKKLTIKKLGIKYKVQTPENFELRKIFELQRRIEKAVEYIENTPLYETTYDYNMEEELEIQNVSDETASNKLLNILRGDK